MSLSTEKRKALLGEIASLIVNYKEKMVVTMNKSDIN
jgi:hypothetical protein